MSALSMGSVMESVGQVEDDDEYWGSLPSSLVHEYTMRLDDITEALDEIDVEELKDFVLAAHSQAGTGRASIDDSIGTIGAATDLKRLDDFTALVTATILQALPYLSRLTRLLHTWSIRLNILRATHAFLRDLKQARTDLDHGWAALAVSPNLGSSKSNISRETMLEMKQVIERQVHSLGRRLDRFLDDLEGREETVPEAWIEEFELLEEQYGEWVVQAERKVLEGEWKVGSAVESDWGQLAGGRGVEKDVAAGAQTGPEQSSNGHIAAAVATTGLAATAIAAGLGATTGTDNRDALKGIGSKHSSYTSNKSKSSSIRNDSRHIPIIVDYSEPYSAFATKQTLPAEPSLELSREALPLPGPPPDTSSQSVKKRAAFLNSDIEKTDALTKSKSAPIVRPFEHASNAFTRLFKRNSHSSDESRSVSEGDQKRSSSSKRDKKIHRNSQISAGSSGKGRASLDSGGRMEYMDMVRVPVRHSEEGNRRDSEPPAKPKKDSRRMEYIDMVRVPERRPEEQNPRLSRPTTAKNVGERVQYGDLAFMPEQPFSNGERTLSDTKRDSLYGVTALPQLRSEESPTTAQKRAPNMYQPSGLSSPFHSPIDAEEEPDFPADWPLSAEVTPMVTPATEDPPVGGRSRRRRRRLEPTGSIA